MDADSKTLCKRRNLSILLLPIIVNDTNIANLPPLLADFVKYNRLALSLIVKWQQKAHSSEMVVVACVLRNVNVVNLDTSGRC